MVKAACLLQFLGFFEGIVRLGINSLFFLIHFGMLWLSNWSLPMKRNLRLRPLLVPLLIEVCVPTKC